MSATSSAGVAAGVAAVVVVVAAVAVIRRRTREMNRRPAGQRCNNAFGVTNPVYELEEPMEALAVIARRTKAANDDFGQPTHYYPGNTLFTR
jgi:hypothetical protein